jgi:hypothetical protein
MTAFVVVPAPLTLLVNSELLKMALRLCNWS